MNLDNYQKNAAYQDNLYSIIIAGAGTGKTHTLLGRIEYLVKQKKLKVEEIVVISYTNETVRDFKEKAFQYLGYQIPVFTFHKFAIILLKACNDSFFLCQEEDFKTIIHEFLYGYCRENPALKKIVLSTFSFLGKWKIGSYQKLIDLKALQSLQEELTQFIHLWKAKGYSNSKLIYNINHTYGKTKAFFLLAYFLIECYASEKSSQLLLDFDDLIEVATDKVKKITKFPYQHILIDEFQDSSLIRIQFLKEIVKHFSLSFTVVGDDCQSIYGFSGTESNCFAILKEYFPSIKTFYLKNTYRNSQELIDIANDFVLKNSNQMKKEIISYLHLKKPIEVLYYVNKSKFYNTLKYILCKEKEKNILFLGRNSFDWKYYFKKEEIHWKNSKIFTLTSFPNQEFIFLTVHQSKGLESDTVILLNMENSTYGFPNQITLRKAIKMILSKEQIKFEEERRLFYVALTRTKGKIYLIAPLFHSSSFIKEIIHDNKNKINITVFH